jgi:ENTH domain
MQYEPIEVQVREATNNDPWGVSTSAMADIARSTHHHDEYSLLFKMVWKRLNDRDHVMHVQKALILTDYLLRNGAERFINDAKRRARDISALQKYKQYDANNRDVGGEVRAKAKSVYELLTNDAKLAEERARAQAIRDVKLSGMGSDGYGPGMSEVGGRDREREDHQERFTDGDGADSPREHDSDRETGSDMQLSPCAQRTTTTRQDCTR